LPLLIIKSAMFSIALFAILGKAGCAPHQVPARYRDLLN